MVLTSLLLGAPLSQAKTVLVGGSGGDLNYSDAQVTLGLAPGDTIGIRAGTYRSLGFGKLRGTAAAKIAIVNVGGQVVITGSCSSCSSNLTDVVHVVFSGTGQSGLEHGFRFHDIPYRAIQLNGDLDSTLIDHCRFENVGDHVIRVNADRKFDGTQETSIEGMEFSHLFVKNSGAVIDWGDYASANTLTGIGRNISIHDNIVDSSQQGTAFRLNKVFEADIHHNTISRMGLGLTSTHPGTILLRGDGRVHHNDIRSVWGVCSRNFGCGLGRTGKVDVYNNIFLGSRKYSALEANTLASDTSSRTLPLYVGNADYRFFHNTIGNQRAADFSAAMVDVYTLAGGRCEIRNNLGFHIAMDKPYNPKTNYVYSLQNPNPPDTSDNLYSPNHADLGLEDTLQVRLKAGSIAIDRGRVLDLVTDDFSGITRSSGAAPDIGAREYVATTRIGARPAGPSATRFVRSGAGWAMQSDDPILQVMVLDPTGRTLWKSSEASLSHSVEVPPTALRSGLNLLRVQTHQGSQTLRWTQLGDH
jgi:hypothetical protein